MRHGVFHQSPHTERALSLPRPRLRGLSHRAAALVWVPIGSWLVAASPAGRPRMATLVFATSIWIMFAVSATVHFRQWSARTTEILFRLDHTAIYLAIAGSATPVALLGMAPGGIRTAVLYAVWGAAVLGIVVEWMPFAAPRGTGNTIYLTMSWATVLALPAVWRFAGPEPVLLLMGGGLLYTVGAAIVGLRRPDPDPEVFGYHEIWHLLVIAAVGMHAAMVALLAGV